MALGHLVILVCARAVKGNERLLEAFKRGALLISLMTMAFRDVLTWDPNLSFNAKTIQVKFKKKKKKCKCHIFLRFTRGGWCQEPWFGT